MLIGLKAVVTVPWTTEGSLYWQDLNFFPRRLNLNHILYFYWVKVAFWVFVNRYSNKFKATLLRHKKVSLCQIGTLFQLACCIQSGPFISPALIYLTTWKETLNTRDHYIGRWWPISVQLILYLSVHICSKWPSIQDGGWRSCHGMFADWPICPFSPANCRMIKEILTKGNNLDWYLSWTIDYY